MTQLSPRAWRLRRALLAIDRERIQLAEIWACMLTAEPELAAHPDRRGLLRVAIDELVSAGWLGLPRGRGATGDADVLPPVVTVGLQAHRATQLGAAQGIEWDPRLAWAAGLELSDDDLADLLRIDAWLRTEGADATIVPSRERSLQLFGAGRESRLAELAASELFADDRLTWTLVAAVPVPPPFVWSSVGPGTTLLVASGHETFASLRRALINVPQPTVGVVAHGAGPYFVHSVVSVRTLDRTIDRILYYGDLDATDLSTPTRAARTATLQGLPDVEPAGELYELLLDVGVPAPAVPRPIDEARSVSAWLPAELRDDAIGHLVHGRRIAQEWVGYEVLMRHPPWTDT